MSKLVKFDASNKQEVYLIGTDEAGRGPVAGSVYAAAVCFKDGVPLEVYGVNDSKLLTEQKREFYYKLIKQNTIYSIQYSTIEQIERVNILNASLDAMKRACEEVINQLNSDEVEIFVDGNKMIKDFKYKQRCVIKGDSKSASIAAASILAKVERDNEMLKLHEEFPNYAWDKNKGYLSNEHLQAIKKFGMTPYHRKKFLRFALAEQGSQLGFFKK